MSRLNQANTYKKQLCHQPDGGVVIFYGANIQGWSHELGDATGQQWQTVGGTEYDGAESWVAL